jgi:hypothetical protein
MEWRELMAVTPERIAELKALHVFHIKWDCSIDIRGRELGDLLDAAEERERLAAEIVALEAELTTAGAVLQEVLPIGKVKHIGLRKIAAGVAELAKIKTDLKGLHKRRCWDCGNTHWHAQDRTPGVLCPECGSQDTRRVK